MSANGAEMTIDELIELVHKRRCARLFTQEPIPDEDIDKILEVARWAMSGANAQPWEFIVVKDHEMRKKIVEAREATQIENYVIEHTKIPDMRRPNLKTTRDGSGVTLAPVFIIVIGDRRTLQATVYSSHFITGEGGVSATYLKNIANATQYINLAAAALDLGARWSSVGLLWEAEIKRLLNIPDIYDVHTVVGVGHMAYQPKPGSRRPLEDIVHREEYDRSKYRNGKQIQEYLINTIAQTTPNYLDINGNPK
jgi:nitroreductase